MRLIIEDRDGLSGEFYDTMQQRADEWADGRLILGGGTDGHVTILAIEMPDGGYGWLKGTRPGENAKVLLWAASVLAELRGEVGAAAVAEYLSEVAGRQVGEHVALVEKHRERHPARPMGEEEQAFFDSLHGGDLDEGLR